MSGAPECAKRFLYALFATLVKPIFDLRLLISGLCALLFTFCLPAQAQQPTKVPRIGYLGGTSLDSARIDDFRQGLRELGYVEGKTIVIERRFSDEKAERERASAAELVRLKVDVIVTVGSISTVPLRKKQLRFRS